MWSCRSCNSPVPKASNWTELVAAQQIFITPQTAITGWTGEAFDEAQAVDWLLQHAKRLENVSAETSPGRRITCPQVANDGDLV